MSYTCNNPKELKDAILRRLGAPVINVEVTEEQIYDCIQRAMELYGEYHYDGLNKAYMAISLTEEQARTGTVVLEPSDAVFAVTRIVRHSSGCIGSFGGTPYTWFTDFINGLANTGGRCNTYGPFGGAGGMSMYTSLMSYMNMLRDILEPLPDYWFNGTNGQLKLFGNFKEGQTIIIEVSVKSFVPLDKSNAVAGGKGITAGVSCGSMAYISDDDIYMNPAREMATRFKAGAGSAEYLDQNVYNVRWLKDYATSLVKEVNGQVLAKHQGMQLPGGVTVDGLRLLEEARTEIETLRDELYGLEEPLGIIMG
ncbi:MAG: hypothetical protein ACRCWQ_09420 [Bacilli bacterium]